MPFEETKEQVKTRKKLAHTASPLQLQPLLTELENASKTASTSDEARKKVIQIAQTLNALVAGTEDPKEKAKLVKAIQPYYDRMVLEQYRVLLESAVKYNVPENATEASLSSLTQTISSNTLRITGLLQEIQTSNTQVAKARSTEKNKLLTTLQQQRQALANLEMQNNIMKLQLAQTERKTREQPAKLMGKMQNSYAMLEVLDTDFGRSTERIAAYHALSQTNNQQQAVKSKLYQSAAEKTLNILDDDESRRNKQREGVLHQLPSIAHGSRSSTETLSETLVSVEQNLHTLKSATSKSSAVTLNLSVMIMNLRTQFKNALSVEQKIRIGSQLNTLVLNIQDEKQKKQYLTLLAADFRPLVNEQFQVLLGNANDPSPKAQEKLKTAWRMIGALDPLQGNRDRALAYTTLASDPHNTKALGTLQIEYRSEQEFGLLDYTLPERQSRVCALELLKNRQDRNFTASPEAPLQLTTSQSIQAKWMEEERERKIKLRNESKKPSRWNIFRLLRRKKKESTFTTMTLADGRIGKPAAVTTVTNEEDPNEDLRRGLAQGGINLDDLKKKLFEKSTLQSSTPSDTLSQRPESQSLKK